jgi:N-methylhydantoinase A
MKFFVGTDVGGTFTDLWVGDEAGGSQVFKSPTTADVMGGVLAAARLAADAYGLSFEAFCEKIERFGHGTTVGLNALLTGRAAKTVIITTEGFADTLEIGRIRRQTSGLAETDVTDFFKHDRFRPLVHRNLILEVSERINVNGEILTPLDEEAARRTIRALSPEGVEAVAICTLWSTVNPVHELQLRDIVAEELPGVFVSLSHQISPLVGEYGRMSTTAANAALGPIAGRYLCALEATLRDSGMRAPILMMTNAGGVLPTQVLNDKPAYSLVSGPAAGVIGSLVLAEQLGAPNVLTTDIGGTSFDVGVIVGGKPLRRAEISLAGADIRVPSIDVASIGAGGGSIATVKFGDLTVGPQSAGASPGPACYGRGGKLPTATDADLVLGVLDPDYFIGGRMRLDREAARNAIREHVAEPLGLSIEEAAWGIREILDNRMADLLRRMTIERGYDPTEFVLLANGGAGPSHAWALARELGLTKFVAPAAATGQSAFGCANSDLGLTDDRPVYLRVGPGMSPKPEGLAAIDRVLQDVKACVLEGLRTAGAQGDMVLEHALSVRYRGQTNTLDVELPAQSFDAEAYEAVVQAFERTYENQFGRGASYSRAGYEIVALRSIGHGKLKPATAAMRGERLQKVGVRQVVFDDPKNSVETTIYRVSYPAAGERAAGPCIIEFPGQSVVAPPGSVAEADAHGNFHISWGAGR